MMDLQYPGWAIFGLTGNEFNFGCFSVLLGGRGGGVHVLSLSISLSFCNMFSVFKVFLDVVNFAFQVAIYIYMCGVPLILLHSVYRFFVPIPMFSSIYTYVLLILLVYFVLLSIVLPFPSVGYMMPSCCYIQRMLA